MILACCASLSDVESRCEITCILDDDDDDDNDDDDELQEHPGDDGDYDDDCSAIIVSLYR